MEPQFRSGNVRARCPDCGAVATFEYRDPTHEFGFFVNGDDAFPTATGRQEAVWILLRCSGCHRGGLAKVYRVRSYDDGDLADFYPHAIERATLPPGVPEGVEREYREAELCASHGAWRGASALLRSCLEKLLGTNGYVKASLYDKVDAASSDEAITATRRKRAHDDVRVLGNDVLHEDWREVRAEEFEAAHGYVQRIIEDLYDDRPTVEAEPSDRCSTNRRDGAAHVVSDKVAGRGGGRAESWLSGAVARRCT